MAASAQVASLSSIPSSYTSFSSSLPFRSHQSGPFVLSPKPKSSKSLKLTSQSLSLRLISPIGISRSVASSDDIQTAISDEVEGESELSGSETDQLLEEQYNEEEKEEGEREKEIKKPASSDDGRLYVGNLPYTTTSSQLAEIFVEAGPVRSVEIIYDRVTDRSRGFAFVTMETVEDAEKAIQMFNSTQIGGRTVKVNFPEVPKGGERKVLEPKIKTSYQGFVDTPNKVYAGNLSWNITSQELRDAFSDQPGFLSAKVIFERETGKSRGFGFVSFSSAEEARSAITALNGVELEGRSLRLNMASEKARFTPSPVVSDSDPSEGSVEESEALLGVSS